MPKPDDPLEYNPEKLDRQREAGSTFLRRMEYDHESLAELLKIVSTQPQESQCQKI